MRKSARLVWLSCGLVLVGAQVGRAHFSGGASGSSKSMVGVGGASAGSGIVGKRKGARNRFLRFDFWNTFNDFWHPVY